MGGHCLRQRIDQGVGAHEGIPSRCGGGGAGMVGLAVDLDLIPVDPLDTRHDTYRHSFLLQHRPLLDMQFQEGMRHHRFGPERRTVCIQLCETVGERRLEGNALIDLGSQDGLGIAPAGKPGGAGGSGGEASAFLVGPGDHLDRPALGNPQCRQGA